MGAGGGMNSQQLDIGILGSKKKITHDLGKWLNTGCKWQWAVLTFFDSIFRACSDCLVRFGHRNSMGVQGPMKLAWPRCLKRHAS